MVVEASKVGSSVGAWADARQVRGGDRGVARRAVEGRESGGTVAMEISVGGGTWSKCIQKEMETWWAAAQAAPQLGLQSRMGT